MTPSNELNKNRVRVNEMWIWRRMERISYTDKVTNEDVLKRADEDRSILNGIWQLKHRSCVKTLQYFARDFRRKNGGEKD